MVNSRLVTLPVRHRTYTVSVVIPVFQGERTLDGVVEELNRLTARSVTPNGRFFRVAEVFLVYDNGPDESDTAIRRIDAAYPVVTALWLSRNVGQHAATLAGMSSSAGEWIVTMDEDGQHDPAAIGAFLDAAIESKSAVVYARFTNNRPNGFFRSASSKMAKRLLGSFFRTPDSSVFQSLRLVRGDVGRQLAQFAVSGVYLDVALSWVTTRITAVPTELRSGGHRPSGYSMTRLFGYFWRMVLTSGTRGLRFVSVLGACSALAGAVFALVIVTKILVGGTVETEGWASLMVVVLMCSGAILVSLGVIAEYVGMSLHVAMGRPLYVLVGDPESGGDEEARSSVKDVSSAEPTGSARSVRNDCQSTPT